jgi:hypothetical protein
MRLNLSVIALLSTATLVSADTLYIGPGRNPDPLRSPAAMRIQANFQFMTPLPAGMETSDQMKAMETVRRTLYDVAAHECDLLKAVFKGSCRLMSLNVNNSLQDRSQGMQSVSAGVNASYEVAPGLEPPQQ